VPLRKHPLLKIGVVISAQSIAMVLVTCVSTASQPPPRRGPDISTLLTTLHAADWTARHDAVEQLQNDPQALAQADVRKALVDLLDRENQVSVSTLRESAETVGVSDKFGEDYSEYVDELSQMVESFADWTDPRQVCVLVRHPYNPKSAFSNKIAAHGKVALPCLMELFRSDLGTLRAKAGPVVVHVLATAKDIDPKTRQVAQEMVVNALRDPNQLVRSFVIFGLADYGTPDSIAALQLVVETDPAPEVDGHSVRKQAANAIASIQKRAGRRDRSN